MGAPQRNYSFTNKKEVKKVRKSRKRISPRKLTRWVFFVCIAYLIFTFSQGFYQAFQLKKEIKHLQSQLADLKVQNSKLQEEIKYMETPEAIEKIAREKLGLIKPGETVVMPAKKAP